MRTIKITGKGEVSMTPDVCRLIITISGIDKTYNKAVEMSSKDTNVLRETIEALGFDRKDLRTKSFSIDARYGSVKDADGNYETVFRGYEYTHVQSLEFPADNKVLGDVLSAMMDSGVGPTFRITYTVSDPESFRQEMMRKAVADAKAKAELLADAAGVVLKGIESINYSWSSYEFTWEPMYDDLAMSEGFVMNKSLSMDIEPEDIRKSDTVTIVWEIA